MGESIQTAYSHTHNNIINGNSLLSHMQGQGSRVQTTFLCRHKFKRGYLSTAHLIYKLTCCSPEGRHAAKCQDSGLCAKMSKMVMCYVTCPRYHNVFC